jgi:hypothetical protein
MLPRYQRHAAEVPGMLKCEHAVDEVRLWCMPPGYNTSLPHTGLVLPGAQACGCKVSIRLLTRAGMRSLIRVKYGNRNDAGVAHWVASPISGIKLTSGKSWRQLYYAGAAIKPIACHMPPRWGDDVAEHRS